MFQQPLTILNHSDQFSLYHCEFRYVFRVLVDSNNICFSQENSPVHISSTGP